VADPTKKIRARVIYYDGQTGFIEISDDEKPAEYVMFCNRLFIRRRTTGAYHEVQPERVRKIGRIHFDSGQTVKF